MAINGAMSKRPKKTAALRDPYWRTLRALGARRRPAGKDYDRAREKAAERAARRDPPDREGR